ncbi:PD-(D/E)XK nuclease family protein [Planctomycetes bacterium Pla163]
MALVHELSWSVSRSGLLADCARSYYNNYYLGWLGWERGAPVERKKAYRLKKLHSMATWAGDSLHVALADWFAERQQGREAPGPDWVRDRALERLRQGYRESRDRADEWDRRPSKLTRLSEHYYGEDSVDEATGEAARYGKRFVERIEKGVACFFEEPALARCRDTDPATWLACEELGTIELFGTKVYAIPDFALKDDGAVWIYDWKTGRPRERDRFQLSLYALYAEQVWGVDPTDVVAVDVYLTTGELSEMRFDRAELEATLARVEESMARMRELHFDADAGVGDAARFPMLEKGDPACGRCNFRELCGR